MPYYTQKSAHILRKLGISVKKWFQATFFRYFLSYFIVFCLSVGSMFFLFRSQLIDTLTKQYENQIAIDLNSAVTRLGEEINSLYAIHTQVTGNVDVMMAKYKNESYQAPLIRNELKKYVVGKHLIQSIGYIDKTHNELYCYSSRDYISYTDGTVTLLTPEESISFRPEDYNSYSLSQLIYLKEGNLNRFICIPVSHSFYNYLVFFVLENVEIEAALKALVSDNVVSTALIAPDGSVALSSGGAKNTFPSITDDDVFLSDTFLNGYRLASLYNPDVLSGRINEALVSGMPAFVLIAIAGFILVTIFTYTAYHPLQRLASKFKSSGHNDPNLLSRLNAAIDNQIIQNDNLQARIEHYRTIMQKMLLDSMLLPENEITHSEIDIDAYFMPPERHFIAAIAILGDAGDENALFGAEDHALIIKREENKTIYLINRRFDVHTSHEEALKNLANAISQKSGVKIGISDTSSSAMDIPSLAQQALSALHCTDDEQKVILYQQLSAENREEETKYQYPYETLHMFSEHLKNRLFDKAKQTVLKLMNMLSSVREQGEAMPDFFIRSVLIDLLSDLAIQMDVMKIKFKDYDDLYFKALYQARSCAFSDSQEEIRRLLFDMLDIFERQTTGVFPNADMIAKIVNENISNPDFSISSLYASFDISLAYMSNLFKKEIGENFSDYLWKARYKKACELLSDKKLSVDEVSLAVGYIHSSSFRRKFKQETGLSPTEYAERGAR